MAIELTRVEEFALITLNRPEALNALSFGLIRDLSRLLDEVASTDARALLVIGAARRRSARAPTSGSSRAARSSSRNEARSSGRRRSRRSSGCRCRPSRVSRALTTPLAEGLRIEADLSTLAFQTRDAAEGMAAFTEKRKPKFSDQ